MATKVLEQSVHSDHLEEKKQASPEAIEAQLIASAAEEVLGADHPPVGSVPVGM